MPSFNTMSEASVSSISSDGSVRKFHKKFWSRWIQPGGSWDAADQKINKLFCWLFFTCFILIPNTKQFTLETVKFIQPTLHHHHHVNHHVVRWASPRTVRTHSAWGKGVTCPPVSQDPSGSLPLTTFIFIFIPPELGSSTMPVLWLCLVCSHWYLHLFHPDISITYRWQCLWLSWILSSKNFFRTGFSTSMSQEGVLLTHFYHFSCLLKVCSLYRICLDFNSSTPW